MKTHNLKILPHLKILPQYYKEVAKNNKTFEVRENDRDFKVGDKIILREWDQGYTDSPEIKAEITYILEKYEDVLKDEYVIFSFRKGDK